MALPRLMVAPNGARLRKADHPAVPITVDEIVDCARTCQAAGADGLHLHLRDADGMHLLDAGQYRAAVKTLSMAVPEMVVQITTEAVGRYTPAEQRQVALESGCAYVSISIREMLREGPDEIAAFYAGLDDRGIAVQHILYDVADANLLASTLPSKILHSKHLQMIFVLGRYTAGQVSDPDALTPFLTWKDALGIAPDWAVCAFGQGETACLATAIAAGGKCRVGFENATVHADGTVAKDNAERVAVIAKLVQARAT